MKKLMIGLVGACALCACGEVASGNIVGYQTKNVTAGDRAMRSAATFLKVGDNPTAVKISDIKQISGDIGDLILCTYNDNVTRLAQYVYVAEDIAAEAEIDAGWYSRLSNGEPDIEMGVQMDVDIPLGQGCVIESSSSNAEYTSAGEVDSIAREFSIAPGARKMMGNVLPRAIMLSELKQFGGDIGDFIFCTYNNNVTRLAQYVYVAEDIAAEAEIDAGWYLRLSNGEPDVENGVVDFEIQSGEGFVVESSSSTPLLRFPKVM